MTEVSYSTSFRKAYKRRILSDRLLCERFVERLEIFKIDPFDLRLRTHKLSGRLEGLYSFRVDADVRVIFYFKEAQHAVFVDIGTHDEVY